MLLLVTMPCNIFPFRAPDSCTDALDRTQTSAVYSVPRSCEAHNACRYPSVTPISLCRLVATATSRDNPIFVENPEQATLIPNHFA